MKNLIEGQPFTNETRAKNEKPTIDANDIVRKIFSGSFGHSQFHSVANNGTYKFMGYSYNLRPYLKRFLVNTSEIGWSEVYFPDIADLHKWHEECYDDEPLEIIEPSKTVPDGCLIIATFRDGRERLYQIDEPLSSSKSDTDWLLSRIEESEVDQKPIGFRTAVIEKLN